MTRETPRLRTRPFGELSPPLSRNAKPRTVRTEGMTSKGSELDVGTGAPENSCSDPPQTVSRSRALSSTLGRAAEPEPVSGLTLSTSNATMPRFAPFRLPLNGP